MRNTARTTGDDAAPELRPIGEADLAALQTRLDRIARADPFSRSAAYYAMTGRRGLWVYGTARTWMLIARHPNRDERILFFPPVGEDPPGLVAQALHDPALPAGDAEMARLGAEDGYLALRLQALGAGEPRTETLLDWTYPVHVISTRRVIERTGGAFNGFRGHINRACRRGLTAVPLAGEQHVAAIHAVLNTWARDGKKAGYSLSDLVTPTTAVLALWQDQRLPVAGVVIFDGDRPVGFWLWDEADRARRTAMSLVRVSIGGHGAAEFGALKMCELLRDRGFEAVCLGGSETESLDRFKRKLCPIRSIELKTARFACRADPPSFIGNVEGCRQVKEALSEEIQT